MRKGVAKGTTPSASARKKDIEQFHLVLGAQAARADNFYYPPEWEPSKGGLNKFLGQHALGDRARKMDKGILVIRFEMPFNVWCDQCGELIGKGVRFNAEKKQIGMYLSTKIWSFKMHHHCGCEIEVVTDPKTCQYLIEKGAKQKDEQYTAEDAQVLDLPDEEEKAKLASDPIFRLERQQEQRLKAAQGKAELSDLLEMQHRRTADGNAYKLNKELKRRMRDAKKDAAALDSRRKELGLPAHIELLPMTDDDKATASREFSQGTTKRAKRSQHKTRQDILHQDIFVGGVKKRSSTSASATASFMKRAPAPVKSSGASISSKAAKLAKRRS